MLNSTNIANERRLVVRLKNYWDSLLEDNTKIPSFTKFNSSFIHDMWDNCMHFEISGKEKQKLYRCEYVGKNLVEGFGKDLESKYISSYDKRLMPGANLLSFMDESVDKIDFVLSQGQFVNHNNKIVKYRNCILPFCDHEDRVKHLIVGLSWRAF